MKVFVGGSRRISHLNFEVMSRLDNIVQANGTILIGDANGADKTIQKYLTEIGYSKVIVFFVGDEYRNNLGNWAVRKIECTSPKKTFSYFAFKDRVMADEADYGFMLWDGKSKGTINNALNLLRKKKKVLVYRSDKKSFITLSGIEQLGDLLKSCDEHTREKLIKDLNMTEFENLSRQTRLYPSEIAA